MKDKRMLQLTVGTELIFFLSLIVSYLYFRQNFPFSFKSEQMLDLKKTGIFSGLLYSSSLTFWLGEQCFKRKWHGGLIFFLGLTFLMGATFLGGQAHEYYKLLSEKNLWVNESEFGTNFFTLTGFHGLHVCVGLICLFTLLVLALKGDFKNGQSTAVNSVGIYWHFVDAVWVAIFLIVYIIPRLL